MAIGDLYPSHREFISGQTNPGSYDIADLDEYVVTSSGNLDPAVVDSIPSTLSRETREQIKQISARLIKTFENRETYMKFLGHREDSALDLLDLLQKLLDYGPRESRFRLLLYVALVRLCRKSELCPRSIYIREGVSGQEDLPRTEGTYGDVFMALYKNEPVSLKVVKLYRNQDPSKVLKAFSREAVVWAQLSHPNILPFYGIHYAKNLQLSLVSPWVHIGTVIEFLDKSSEANRICLIKGIAAGMKYLHENGVVHGDLKPSNILVLEPEQALLADFGYSYITDDDGLDGPALSSSHTQGHTKDFSALEIIQDPTSKRTRETDVFAFGMVCYQLFTYPSLPNVKVDKIPYVHLRIVSRSPRVLGRFTGYSSRGLTNELWEIIETCWSHRPDARPTAAMIVQRLPLPRTNYVSHGWYLPSRPGFKDGQDDTIRKALSYL